MGKEEQGFPSKRKGGDGRIAFRPSLRLDWTDPGPRKPGTAVNFS